MPNPSPGGNWKHNQPAATPGKSAPVPAPNASRRSWMPGTTAPTTTQKKTGRGKRIILASLFAGALVSLIVVLFYLFSPQKAVEFVLVAPDAPDSLALPENIASVNGLSAVSDWAKSRGSKTRLAAPLNETTPEGWKSKLNKAAPAIVLYFAAPGGADSDGPFLWMIPAEARNPTDAHKLRVKDILDRLAGMPTSQPKLLVFDCAQHHSSWVHGALHNDFARSLKGLDSAIEKVPGLAVFCAADEHERSWVSEEWRMSVFNYYFTEALKGAAGQANQRINGRDLAEYVSRETNRWAVANRNEPQTPFLLPQATGKDRASKLEPSDTPPSGYTTPAAPDVPNALPADLIAAWDEAERLWGSTSFDETADAKAAMPDTFDPTKWREYLDLLQRWERQARMGQNSTNVSRRVAALHAELRNPTGAESLASPAALPIARALGNAKQDGSRDGMEQIWAPKPGTHRADHWAKLLADNPNRESRVRSELAADLIARVLRDDCSAEALKTADEVLAVVDGSRVSAAETHLLRMFDMHLHATQRPQPALLKQAIEMRIVGERASWFGDVSKKASTEPVRNPHAEHVARWIRASIEAGDRERAFGQDLLFHTDVEFHAKAEARFTEALKHYTQAAEDAQIVANALHTRDRILSRLPYYARWITHDRGIRNAIETEELVVAAELAAQSAHDLDARLRNVPEAPLRAGRMMELKTITNTAQQSFNSIVQNLETLVFKLNASEQTSNWHILEQVLQVPFIPAKRRAELLGFHRAISHRLASSFQQQPGTSVTPLSARASARAEGRIALAMLGKSDAISGVSSLLNDQNAATQWDGLRDAGHKIGLRYRAIPGEAAAVLDRALATKLSEAHTSLAQSSFLSRLAMSAAPLRNGESPVAAEQRYLRHDLLLWQAHRTTTEGWADVVPSAPEKWYARRVAELFTRAAETLILNGATNLQPEESDRLLAACRKQVAEVPAVLDVAALAAQELADEPAWEFRTTVSQVASATPIPVGYPVMWLNTPGKPFTDEKLANGPRSILRELADAQQPAKARTLFHTTKTNENPTSSLETNVLYRGHVYRKTTSLLLAGAPTLEWIHRPPQGPASFAILAEAGLVNGAVTLLIDYSGSMLDLLTEKQTKLQVLHDALEKVLNGLPSKTVLTIALFWGDGNVVNVEALAGVSKLTWSGDANQIEAVMKLVKSRSPNITANTPLAKSVRRMLSKEEFYSFFPKDSTGVRTLAVLTDGLDNHSPNDAAIIVREALLQSPEEVSMHLMFFALPGDEKIKIQAQYQPLNDADPFRTKNRTPPTIWNDDARTADALAARLQQAMLPRIVYRQEETAKGLKATGSIRVSLPREKLIQSSPALEAGVFNMYGLRANQKMQLEPGDRLLFHTRARGNSFDLFLPAHSFNTADKLGYPRASGSAGPRSGIQLAIPQLDIPVGNNAFCNLKLTTTLEPVGIQDEAPVLKAPRPLFAWFDVRHSEGKPLPDLIPRVKVVNTPGLIAPAWTIDVARWDRNSKTARMPSVQASWIEGKPGNASKVTIQSLNDIDQEFEKLAKSTTIAGEIVKFVGMNIDDLRGDSTLPDGKYLTVRLNYGTSGKPVFIRPGSLKGPRQPYLLHERHLYFDDQSRYTARFGPLLPDELNAGVELEIYSVAELRTAAEKSGRSATIRVTNTEANRSFNKLTALKQDPAGK